MVMSNSITREIAVQVLGHQSFHYASEIPQDLQRFFNSLEKEESLGRYRSLQLFSCLTISYLCIMLPQF
jgi:hypothetical protein